VKGKPTTPAAAALVETLGLEPDPSGGWSAPIHEVRGPSGREAIASHRLRLLDADQPVCFLHRTTAEVVLYFHHGDGLLVTEADEGRVVEQVLGSVWTRGETLQIAISPRLWRAFQLSGGSWVLFSETTVANGAPDVVLAGSADLQAAFPDAEPGLERLLRP
jgi:predicted cupin superfamily sugar epimerase